MRQDSYDAALEAWNDRPDYNTMDRLQIAIDVATETEQGEVTEYLEVRKDGETASLVIERKL